MVSQVNPSICVTYHEPLESTTVFVENIDTVNRLATERALTIEQENEYKNAELFEEKLESPKKIGSRYSRFISKIPSALRPRSKSAGVVDRSMIKSAMNFNSLEYDSISPDKYQSIKRNSPVVKKNKMSNKDSNTTKSSKISDLGSKISVNVNTSTKSDDKKYQSQISDSSQLKKGNLLKNFQIIGKPRPKSESANQYSVGSNFNAAQKLSGKQTTNPNQNAILLCSECPPPKSSKYNETGNPQLFPILQRKELTGNQCKHNETGNSVIDQIKTKRQNKASTIVAGDKSMKDHKHGDLSYNYRTRSNSGPYYDRKMAASNLPDPTSLPEWEPMSSLTFCRTPLKSSHDNRYWVNGTKNAESGSFQKLSKTSISKSEQNLVFSGPSKRIVEALSKSRPTLDLGNETIEAAYRYGVNRVTENNQFVILSKSSTRDASTYLAEGLHTLSEAESFYAFFQHSTCYDMMPDNSKLVVLDSRLQVGKAFRALIFNGVRAALIWQTELQKYVGILTITDFIKILNLYIEKTPGVSIIDIESQTIDKWREMTGTINKPLVFVTPESSLFTALKELQNLKVHRLPVIDLRSGNALHIITHKRLLKYLYIKKSKIPNAELLKCTIEDANVGTFKDVHTVTLDTSIKDALYIFETKQISAVPVLDPETKKLLDIYAKYDCIHLASTGNYKDLNLTIAQGLAFRVQSSFSVQTCLKTDTLDFVMEKIVLSEVHRLVVINNEVERQVRGIVSLADLLHYFVLRYNGRHSTGNITSGISCCSNLNSSLNISDQESHRHNSSPSSLNVNTEDCVFNANV